jgi:hypothetical protein
MTFARKSPHHVYHIMSDGGATKCGRTVRVSAARNLAPVSAAIAMKDVCQACRRMAER